jgi:streptogramin lyase
MGRKTRAKIAAAQAEVAQNDMAGDPLPRCLRRHHPFRARRVGIDGHLRALTLEAILRTICSEESTDLMTLHARLMSMLAVTHRLVLQALALLRHVPGWRASWREFLKHRAEVDRRYTLAARVALAALGLQLLVLVPSAVALSITQHPLPNGCGSQHCAPAPATAMMVAGPNRVLASGVESGDVYSEVILGTTVAMTRGPSGEPASQIVLGPNGAPLVLTNGMPAVDEVTPGGVATKYQYAPEAKAQPLDVAVGLESIWIISGEEVDRVESDGHLNEITLPGTLPNDTPRKIVVGPEESAWFTDYDGAIDQITAAGKLIEYSSEPEPLDPLRATPAPTDVAVGPEGDIWWTDSTHGRIARMGSNGAVQEYTIPQHGPTYESAGQPQPEAIVSGPEGECMYFTDPGDESIGRVAISTGEVTEYPIPSLAPPGALPEIAVLGDELVFDEGQVAALGTVTPTASPGETPLDTPPVVSTLAPSLRTQLRAVERLAAAAFSDLSGTFRVPFTPPERGRLVLTWIAEARRPGRRTTVATHVATGEEAFALGEPGTVKITLTPAGSRMLRGVAGRRSRIRLTVHAAFSGYWTGATDVSERQAR